VCKNTLEIYLFENPLFALQ